jgi:hypothetical protein
VFTAQDFRDVAELCVAAWRSGVDLDWSVKAGTLEWTCRHTAEHTVDAVLAPALFLASRRHDAYPPIKDLEIEATATPSDLVDCLQAVTNVVFAVLVTTDPEVRAIIRRHPTPETAAATDFAPRSGLELILHTFDICSGLGIPFEPPPAHCRRLLAHTRDWPGAMAITPTADAWSDLLASRRRPRPS